MPRSLSPSKVKLGRGLRVCGANNVNILHSLQSFLYLLSSQGSRSESGWEPHEAERFVLFHAHSHVFPRGRGCRAWNLAGSWPLVLPGESISLYFWVKNHKLNPYPIKWAILLGPGPLLSLMMTLGRKKLMGLKNMLLTSLVLPNTPWSSLFLHHKLRRIGRVCVCVCVCCLSSRKVQCIFW